MSDALSIAASGMKVAALRLQVSASNVANASSSGPLPTAKNSGSFPPAYTSLRVDQTDVASGGTTAAVKPIVPSTTPTYDPTAPYADGKGMVAMPNVDLADEMVQLMPTRFAFAANAYIARVDKRMMNSLLDIAT
jgi:flagellar basal-body rod protein FlgC